MTTPDLIAEIIAAGFELLARGHVAMVVAAVSDVVDFIALDQPAADDFGDFGMLDDLRTRTGSQLLRDIARADRRDARRLGVAA